MKNKDYKCQYLLVDAKNIVNYSVDVLKQRFISYNKCDKPFIDLNEIFESYDIPLEYRYIVIRMNSFLSKYECQEYLTEIPFDYTGYTRYKKNSPKIIRGRAITNNPTNIVEFEALMDYKTYSDVICFYAKLINADIFDRYKAALSKIFSIVYSYDNIECIKRYRNVNKNRS